MESKHSEELESVTLNYEDGTQEKESKACVITFSEDAEKGTVCLSCANISGADLYCIFTAVVEMGAKMGFLNDAKKAAEK